MSPRPSTVRHVLPSVLLALAGSSDTLGGNPFPASINLSELNGANGFAITGADQNDFSGCSVCAAGDVNGDGVDDVLVGTRNGDPNGVYNAGESYVVFGKDTSVAGNFAASIHPSSLHGTTGFVINGIAGQDWTGLDVSPAGDVNHDGIDDILIGSARPNPNGLSHAGAAYVVLGAPSIGASGSLNLSSLNGANGFVLNGINPYDRCGTAVSGAGDINNDGIDDILIGAFGADPNGMLDAGQAYVVFGKDTAAAGAFGAAINLSSLDGTTGFRLDGIDPYDSAGLAVSSAGDMNGDGIDDLIIGARFADPNGQGEAGESYVVFGHTLAPAPCVGDVSGDNRTTVLDFNILAAWFGESVPPGTNGDLSGDGFVNTADFNILAGDFGCVP